MSIRVVLSDPHPIVLFGLTSLLGREDDLDVVAQCVQAGEVLDTVRTHQPDILVTELCFPGNDGLAMIEALRQEKLPVKFVIFAVAITTEQAMAALQVGVDGVVLKNMPTHMLIQCLRKVQAGGQWLEKDSFGRVMERVLRREAEVRQLASILSPRELSLVQLVSTGLSNREIGNKLFISEGTVKIHLGNIYRKLGIDSRVDLAMLARDKGLV